MSGIRPDFRRDRLLFCRSIREFFASLLCLAVIFGASGVAAETISFPQVLAAALSNSFDIKIAREELGASQAFVREKQAAFYPQLSVRFSNDYIHAFERQSQVASGGDIVIADESNYRHSLITSLGYNLFDFGVRKLGVANARRQVFIAALQEKQAYWETRKEVLRLFARGLKIQKQLATDQSVLERQKTIFRLTRQLHQAGTLGQEQVGTAALSLAETLSQQTELKVQLQEVLGRLTFYTHQQYAVAEIQLADLVPPRTESSMLKFDAAPEVQILRTRIENKKTELVMIKRSLLPTLELSAYHRMFGSDPGSFAKSLTDLSARDATIALTFNWPLFSGFADIAKIARINHEISSLRYQKEKKRAELQDEASHMTSAYEAYAANVKNRLNHLNEIAAEKTGAVRLAAQQVTDQISFQQKIIALTRQQLGVELRQVDYAMTALSLAAMQKAMP